MVIWVGVYVSKCSQGWIKAKEHHTWLFDKNSNREPLTELQENFN